MRFATLQDWLAWLESCHPQEIELGLQRVATAAQRLGVDSGDSVVITVAGTNGKGSCVACLNALLISAGCRVGCYTSPHFVDYNERIRIDDQPIDDQSLIDAFARIDRARADIPLTYFEFGTLAALDIFQRSALDVIVLEVGLGGRLDAVNIIDPDIAIVTCIDLDHQQWLGDNREQIGAEKAGIFRAAKPAVCADPDPPDSLQARADAVGAHWYARGADFDITELGAQTWSWRGRSRLMAERTLVDLPRPQLPIDSAAAALQAVQLLEGSGIDIANVDYQCLARLQLPGRFQCVEAQGRQLIFDVAHNPGAARYLAARLREKPVSGRSHALFAVMADKDVPGIVAALQHSFDSWTVADLDNNSRAMAASDLAELIRWQGIEQVTIDSTVAQAYRRLLSAMTAQDRLVVFGSFVTVAAVMQLQLLKVREQRVDE